MDSAEIVQGIRGCVGHRTHVWFKDGSVGNVG